MVARPGADRDRFQRDDGRGSAISTRGRERPSNFRPGAPPTRAAEALKMETRAFLDRAANSAHSPVAVAGWEPG